MTVHGLSYHLVVCLTRARNLANRDHDEHWGQSASDPYVGIFLGDLECVSTPMRAVSYTHLTLPTILLV